MGFITASVFLTITTKREKEFVEFIHRSPFISWAGMFSGKWNFGMDLYATTNEELDQRLKDMLGTFKEDIIEHRLSIYRNKSFFYEKYFGKKTGRIPQTLQKEYVADAKDKFILKKLTKNSRTDVVSISQELKMSAPAVAHRIRNLHDTGYITKYTLFVDLSTLQLYQYSIFIENDRFEEKKKADEISSGTPTGEFYYGISWRTISRIRHLHFKPI
jgi:predicted transcriptional regulator